MVTFVHTSDWQLGLKLGYIPGDKGALQREVRFETLDRIVAVAKDNKADFVVVAGDAFDDNGVSDRTIRQALERLKPLAPIPMYILPGNHDPLTPDSVYRRDTFGREKPEHVHVLDSNEPVPVPGTNAVLLGCPLMRRHEFDDPTGHLQPDPGATQVRVAVAHGSMDVLPDAAESSNRIDPDVAERTGIDYLALGDWHGTWNYGQRIWYSGTHEQTKFNEADTGNVLLVKIAQPGATPVVTPHRVGQTTWVRHDIDLAAGQDIAALKSWYAGLGDCGRTLVELTLRGSLSLSDREKLDDLIARQGDLLRWQRVRDDDLVTTASDDDLDGIATAGFVRTAVERLRDQSESTDAETAREARGALQLLYRLNRKLTGAMK